MLQDLSQVDLAAAVAAVKRELEELCGLPAGCVVHLPSQLVGREICQVNPNIIGENIGMLQFKTGLIGVLYRVANCWVLRFSAPSAIVSFARSVSQELAIGDVRPEARVDHFGSIDQFGCFIMTMDALAKLIELFRKSSYNFCECPAPLAEETLAAILANRVTG
jgi:hypothetical protein